MQLLIHKVSKTTVMLACKLCSVQRDRVTQSNEMSISYNGQVKLRHSCKLASLHLRRINGLLKKISGSFQSYMVFNNAEVKKDVKWLHVWPVIQNQLQSVSRYRQTAVTTKVNIRFELPTFYDQFTAAQNCNVQICEINGNKDLILIVNAATACMDQIMALQATWFH